MIFLNFPYLTLQQTLSEINFYTSIIILVVHTQNFNVLIVYTFL